MRIALAERSAYDLYLGRAQRHAQLVRCAGLDAAAGYLRAFVEDAKASGFVARVIARNGVDGVSVAGLAGDVLKRS